jgi:hypothetical protein
MDFERLNIDNGFLNLAKSEKKKCEEIKIHNPLNDLEYVQLSNGGGFIARIQKSDKKADGFATNNPIYKIIFEKYGPSGKLSFKFESIEGELHIFQTNFVLVESIKGNPLNSLRNTLEKAYPYKEL